MSLTAAGIDVGGRRFHAVLLDGGAVRAAAQFEGADLDSIVDFCTGAQAVAVDAPARASTAPHRDDPSLSPKFRTARCAEIAAGQRLRIWVPWVTPVAGSPMPGWMQAGFALWTALANGGHDPLEVYPYGCYRLVARRPLARKTTPLGCQQRASLMERLIGPSAAPARWGHDLLDAAMAAWVASRPDRLTAGHSSPGCDGSTMAFPPSAAEPMPHAG